MNKFRVLGTMLTSVAAAALMMAAPAQADEVAVEQAQAATASAGAPGTFGGPYGPPEKFGFTGGWQVRVRAMGVVPDTNASTVNVQGVPSLSTPFSGLSVGNSIVPELDISYYFNPNIALELILGVTGHNVTGNGSLNGLNIGSTLLLPPTLTAQYHFTNMGAFQPYVGAGINLTIPLSTQNAGATTAGGLTTTQFSLNTAVGLALQAGFDYMIDRNWGVNFDVKKLILRPGYNATVNNTIPVSGTAALDPWLFGVGVTYRF
ncbi:MAG: outer membrane beta-barrel protein [Proteobacteria bacterium]|nr:outer membrane beta-barrel protein [Pseudomonadota bacterium]